MKRNTERNKKEKDRERKRERRKDSEKDGGVFNDIITFLVNMLCSIKLNMAVWQGGACSASYYRYGYAWSQFRRHSKKTERSLIDNYRMASHRIT